MCSKANLKLAKLIDAPFNKKLIELYGIAPSLHIEYIDKTPDEDDEIAEWDDAFLAEMNSWDN